jgi:hypothetical protein
MQDLIKEYKEHKFQKGFEYAKKLFLTGLGLLWEELFDEVVKALSQIGTRTWLQNRSIHLFCRLLAEALNDSGQEMRDPFFEGGTIPWSMISVKEHVWKPIQKAVLKKESTKLLKTNEVNRIHEIIMRNMGERRGIEYIPFPNMADKTLTE